MSAYIDDETQTFIAITFMLALAPFPFFDEFVQLL